MSTCDHLDSQTLGSQPAMPKNLLDYCRLHIDVFRFLFIDWRYILSFSSKMISDSPEVLEFSRLFLKLDQCICN